MSPRPHTLGLVTDRTEWKPLLAAAEAAGISAWAVTIQQEHIWDEDTCRNRLGPKIEVEIRHDRTWSMDEAGRAALERTLRAAAPPHWNTPAMRFLWRKPIPSEWGSAWLDAIDKLWRDWHRRRISDDSLWSAHDKIYGLHDRVSDDAEDHRPLMALLAETLAEARRHPPSPKYLPPLRPDQIGVAEVMTVLRRIASGAVRPRVIYPADGWGHVWHSIGEFEVDDWVIEAFKRTSGMKYVQSVRAPDGRTADYDYFEEREGNPFHLLEDDEQDAISDVLDAL